jgi:rubrerythrin
MERNIFAPDEILRLAIRIEENGKTFYEEMSKRREESEVKELLSFLSQEETKHKKIFEEILGKLEDTFVAESYSGEYSAYMNALAKECVFTQDLVEKKIKEYFASVLELLDFALRIERDSMLLYSKMKENVIKNQEVLDKVIQEEANHFVKISTLKNKYQG